MAPRVLVQSCCGMARAPGDAGDLPVGAPTHDSSTLSQAAHPNHSVPEAIATLFSGAQLAACCRSLHVLTYVYFIQLAGVFTKFSFSAASECCHPFALTSTTIKPAHRIQRPKKMGVCSTTGLPNNAS